MQDVSGLLKEALDLLRQYNAAPALQLEVQTAYEVRASAPAFAKSVTAGSVPMCVWPSSVRAFSSIDGLHTSPPIVMTTCCVGSVPWQLPFDKPHCDLRSFHTEHFDCSRQTMLSPYVVGATGPGGAAADSSAPPRG